MSAFFPASGYSYWVFSFLCASPALIFWSAQFSKKRLTWTVLGLIFFLGSLTALAAPIQIKATALSCLFWSVTAAFWAYTEYAKDQKKDAASKSSLEELIKKSEETSSRLSDLKLEMVKIEREQKKTLALYGAVKSLAQALGWEDTKPILESAVEQYLGATSYSFYVGSSGGNSDFDMLLCRGLHDSPGSSAASLKKCLGEHSLSYRQVCVIHSPEEAIVVPFEDNGEVLGLFYSRIPHGANSDEFLKSSKIFAGEIAFAFRRLKLFQDVENLSRIDGLTGAHRRGEFEERLRHEIIRARTFKTTVGILMLDIDHFKKLNDRYGHPFGDQVLKRVGEILNASVYETDFVARYGGEEFVVILPRAEPAGALRKAETIRASIEAEKFSIAFETVSATVSIGMSHFPRDAFEPVALLAEADRALYAAKAGGRNQVVDASQVKKSQ